MYNDIPNLFIVKHTIHKHVIVFEKTCSFDFSDYEKFLNMSSSLFEIVADFK